MVSVVTLLMLTHPTVIRQPASEAERQRVVEIVQKYGRSIVSPLAVFDDKHYFFSRGGSVIAYAVHGRGAMVLGDPIGPTEDAKAAISAFKAFCARNDWQPGFMCVLPDRLTDYRSNGFDTACVAYEAVLPLTSFTLEGHVNTGFRKPYNKLAHLGYKARIFSPPLKEDLLQELRMVNDDWLSTRLGGEKYFCVGWFNKKYLRNCPVIAVHDPDGKVVAFANLLIVRQKIEMTCDLARYRRNMENGLMEYMVVSMLNWAKSLGYETFSLTASTFTGKGTSQNNSYMTKTLNTFSYLINPFIPLKGLYTFYNKFHPRWEPRYIAYPGMTALPLFLLTLYLVYTGRKTQ
jgi:phosphatidylglycerol lysyltransferase